MRFSLAEPRWTEVFESDPFEEGQMGEYLQLPMVTRVRLVYRLCEWALDDYEVLHTKPLKQGQSFDENPDLARTSPLCTSSDDSWLWFFRNDSGFCFREEIPKKTRKRTGQSSFQVHTRTVEQLEALGNELLKSKSKERRDAGTKLLEEEVPRFTKRGLKKERAERKAMLLEHSLLKRSSRIQMTEVKKQEDMMKQLQLEKEERERRNAEENARREKERLKKVQIRDQQREELLRESREKLRAERAAKRALALEQEALTGILAPAESPEPTGEEGGVPMGEIQPLDLAGEPEKEEQNVVLTDVEQMPLKKAQKEKEKKTADSAKKKRSNAKVEEENWVQCDACDKWRRLKKNQKVAAEEMFTCNMLSSVTCATPEESYGAEDYSEPVVPKKKPRKEYTKRAVAPADNHQTLTGSSGNQHQKTPTTPQSQQQSTNGFPNSFQHPNGIQFAPYMTTQMLQQQNPNNAPFSPMLFFDSSNYYRPPMQPMTNFAPPALSQNFAPPPNMFAGMHLFPQWNQNPNFIPR